MHALFYATNTLSGETHLSFEDLGVDKRIASQLSHIGITTPTDIQQQAVPVAIAGHDLLAQSKTGSGKTFAFLLPAITRLSKQKALSKRDPRALIITPTRELANQVYKQLTLIIAGTGLKATKIVGGDPIKKHQYPWLCSLKAGGSHVCGVTIIGLFIYI